MALLGLAPMAVTCPQDRMLTDLSALQPPHLPGPPVSAGSHGEYSGSTFSHPVSCGGRGAVTPSWHHGITDVDEGWVLRMDTTCGKAASL